MPDDAPVMRIVLGDWPAIPGISARATEGRNGSDRTVAVAVEITSLRPTKRFDGVVPVLIEYGSQSAQKVSRRDAIMYKVISVCADKA